MKKKVTFVLNNECAMDVLAELGEETKDAWIWVHKNVTENLKKDADSVMAEGFGGHFRIRWKATEESPETEILIYCGEKGSEWDKVLTISADDIAYTTMPSDPEELLFLKMEDK